MQYEIRPFESRDLHQVHALLVEFAHFIGTPEKLLITPEQMMAQRDHFSCLLAVSGEMVIGYACYFPAYYSWTGKAFYLDDLYVQPPYRGQGVGQALLDAVIGKARAAGCFKLRWQVSRWNHRAIAFYRKQGATIDDVEINCDLKLESSGQR